MDAYRAAFNDCNALEVAHALTAGDGYYIFEDIIAEDALAEILSCIELKEYLVNNNSVGVVRASSMNFHSHTLAVSKCCYDLVTHEKTRAICSSFFTGPHKISNQRIFETHTKAHMPWHTDNNLQDGNTFKGKHELPGILFLFYLSDVSEINPFQLVPGSHKWSAQHNQRFFADKYIDQTHSADIVSVKAPKGSLILCNTHLIHRAKPFDVPGFRRKTFLFQIDAISENHLGHGEQLLINPSFVDDADPEILKYLGFGSKANYPTFPQTSVATMSPRDLWLLQKNILPKTIRGLALSFLKKALPSTALISLKNLTAPKQ
jgi:ectoine hydroxylase-related dioxygenase (phytanoyl-CoA dioxygenase family)